MATTSRMSSSQMSGSTTSNLASVESPPPMDFKTKMYSMTNVALENIGLDQKLEGPTWASKAESLAGVISFILCSNNFWIFSFMCAHHGGWFPYQFTICFVFIAVPLLYMEMGLGQFSSASPLSVFSRIVPAMAGLSAGMTFLLLFRTISLSTWSVFNLVISSHTTQALWKEPDWMRCPATDSKCLDHKLQYCIWSAVNYTSECDVYKNSLIINRGIQTRKTPFMAFIHEVVLKQRSVIISDWSPPSVMSIVCAIVIWIAVGILAIGGSKVLGKSGYAALILLTVCQISLFVIGLTFPGTLDVIEVFFYPTTMYEDKWMWMYSWADAAAQAVRALNVGCGGIQKMTSLNKFRNKLQHDVLIVSIMTYLFYIFTALFSFMFMAEVARFYYPSLEVVYRIPLYCTPMVTQASISEVLANFRFGSFFIFVTWITMVICGVQGLASNIWIVSSMVIERLNARKRKYGKTLTGWKKRAIIVGLMSLCSFLSTLPFLSNGGMNLMITVEAYVSYGTLFVAFFELVTVSYIYGFKRFSVNMRTMIGGRGVVNIYWWLSWIFISPVMLLVVFGCVVATFHSRQNFYGGTFDIEYLGWVLLFMSVIFIFLYFIREDYFRRKNTEPFVTLLRATGDWGPASLEDRKEATRLERALRVRY